MADKMLIDATHPEETRVVVLRGNRVEEFDFESANRKQLRGNIYLAKVTRVEPSLQAAFVDYGGNRHGFLAFSEIHPDYYQIPVADRQALIAEEERDAARSRRRCRQPRRIGAVAAAAIVTAAPVDRRASRRASEPKWRAKKRRSEAAELRAGGRATGEPTPDRPIAGRRRRVDWREPGRLKPTPPHEPKRRSDDGHGADRRETRCRRRNAGLSRLGSAAPSRPMTSRRRAAVAEARRRAGRRRRPRRDRRRSAPEADAPRTAAGREAETDERQRQRRRPCRRGSRGIRRRRRRARRSAGAPAALPPPVQDSRSDQAPPGHAGAGGQGRARHQGRGADDLSLARRPLFGADAQHRARRRHFAQDHLGRRPRPPEGNRAGTGSAGRHGRDPAHRRRQPHQDGSQTRLRISAAPVGDRARSHAQIDGAEAGLRGRLAGQALDPRSLLQGHRRDRRRRRGRLQGSARLHAHADAEPRQEREALQGQRSRSSRATASRASSTPCSRRSCSCDPAATSSSTRPKRWSPST